MVLFESVYFLALPSISTFAHVAAQLRQSEMVKFQVYRDSDSEPSQRRLGGPARKRRPHSTGPWTGQVQHGYCLRHVPWYRVGLLIFKSRSHPRLYLAAAAAASASASDRTGHDLAGPGPNIL